MKRTLSVPPVDTFASRKLKPVDPDVEKGNVVPWWWMRNDKGRKSVSVTFATMSFIVTTLVYLAATFEKIGPISFRAFDVGACMAYFLPALSLYFGRRLTDAKYANDTKSSQNDQIG